LLAAHRGDRVRSQIRCDIWWTKWYRGGFSPSTLILPPIFIPPTGPHSLILSSILYIVLVLIASLNNQLKTFGYEESVLAINCCFNQNVTIKRIFFCNIPCIFDLFERPVSGSVTFAVSDTVRDIYHITGCILRTLFT
jgi:hypothetical protein